MPATKANKTSFKPGETGNAAGRPPGTAPRARFRKLIEADMPGIVEQLVANAKAGDVQAAKVLIDRLIPSLKPTSDSLNMKVSGSLSEQGAAIVKAMTAGQVTPDQAKSAMDVILAQSHLVDQTEIINQLNEFSQWLQSSKR